MKSINNKILVSCNLEQKEYLTIGETKLKMATLFETNYREKSPVIAIAKQTKGEITEGDVLVIHHNTFYQPSPYWLQDDLFSIPYNHTIFGVIDNQGNAKPVCGNMFVKKVDIPTAFPLPPEQIEQYIDRYIVADAGRMPYKKEQLVFTRPNSGYTIVYIWDDIEFRVNKINSDMVVGCI